MMAPERRDDAIALSIYGPWRLADARGRELPLRGRKARAILAMLALAPDGTRERTWLRERLWSDRRPGEAAASLRQSVLEIRRALGPAGDVLETDRHVVRLDLRCVRINAGTEGALLEDVRPRDPAFDRWLAEVTAAPSLVLPASEPDGGEPVPAVPTPSLGPNPAGALRRANELPVLAVAVATDRGRPSDAEREAVRQVCDHLSSWRTTSVLAPLLVEDVLLAGAGTSPVPSFRVRDTLRCEYLVELSFPSRNEERTVRADLLDADALLLWSATFPWGADAAGRERVAEQIAGNAATVVDQNEQKRAAADPDDANVRNLVARGRWHLHVMDRRNARMAFDLFGRAEALNPYSVGVQVNLAFAKLVSAWVDRGPPALLEEARQAALRVARQDESHAAAFYVAGTCASLLRERDAAALAVTEAVALAPSFPLAHAQNGSNLIAEGRYGEAADALERALELGHTDRRRYWSLGELAMARLLDGQTDEAVRAAERAIALRPRYWYAHMVRLVAHRRAGRNDDAEEARRVLFKVWPGLSHDEIAWLPFEDRSICRGLAEACGLPPG